MATRRRQRKQMTEDRARLVLEYTQFPNNTYGCIDLIKRAGHEHINTNRGLVPLERETSDDRIRAYAHRLYEEAQIVLGRKLSPRMQAVTDHWYNHLYEIFNIPPEQRGDVVPSDLEAELLK
ncbi:MAG: hypothetical protein Q8Q01_04780 [archaeon]|nr:hypothetical protein [archaeon]